MDWRELLSDPQLYWAGCLLAAGGFTLYNLKIRAQLKEEVQKGSEIIDRLSEGFYRSSLDGRQLSANRALVKLNGYNSEEELLSAVTDIANQWYVDPDRRAEFKRILFEKGEVIDFKSEVYRHKTRERVWISENARLVFDRQNGEPLYYEGTVREITGEIREQQLEDQLGKLAANLPGGLFQLHRLPNGQFTVPYVSDSFLKLMSRDIAVTSSSPNSYLKFIHPDDIEAYLSALRLSGERLRQLNHRFRYQRDDGTYRWLHITATPEKLKDNGIIWHGHVSDVTTERENELQLERLAYNDALTGLPKRAVMEDRLLAMITSCNRRDEHAAVLFLDLDDFKLLNDTYGHGAGDGILVRASRRMESCMRASDVICRYGGDEFVILADNLGGDREEAMLAAEAIAEKVRRAFEAAFKIDDSEVSITPSIGIAMVDPGRPSPEQVLKAADKAMYEAKRNGGNRSRSEFPEIAEPMVKARTVA